MHAARCNWSHGQSHVIKACAWGTFKHVRASLFPVSISINADIAGIRSEGTQHRAQQRNKSYRWPAFSVHNDEISRKVMSWHQSSEQTSSNWPCEKEFSEEQWPRTRTGDLTKNFARRCLCFNFNFIPLFEFHCLLSF